MNIGIDLDDVLLSFNESFLPYHNKKYGTSIRKDDITDFGLEKFLNCSVDEMLARFTTYFTSEEHADSSPVEGAVEAVITLAQKHNLYVITAKPATLAESTRKWLDVHFPNVLPRIHFADHVGNTTQKRKKSEICQELGIDILIDDAIHNANDAAGVVKKVFLFSQPWNKTETHLKPNVIRVHSWAEIVESINKGI